MTALRTPCTSHDGLDPRFLMSITDQYGSIDKGKASAAGYKIEEGGEWIKKEADVLIPAALEGQVNADSVKLVHERVKLVAEGANGPTTPEADEEFCSRNVFVIPDFLCNAGGVTVSYFESVQNDMNYYWTKDEVLQRLDTKMTTAFGDVLKMSLSREGLHARRGLHGGDRPRGQGHGAAGLDLEKIPIPLPTGTVEITEI